MQGRGEKITRFTLYPPRYYKVQGYKVPQVGASTLCSLKSVKRSELDDVSGVALGPSWLSSRVSVFDLS